MKDPNSETVANEIPITLRLPFSGLSKFGLFSPKIFKKYFPMTTFALSSMALVIIGMIQFINMEKDVSDFVRNAENVASFTQITGKIVVTTYRLNDFTRLMETAKLFWRPDMCNKETETKLNSMYSMIFNLQKLFLLFLALAGTFLMVVPLLEDSLAIGIWTLQGYERLYRFTSVVQLIIIPFSGVFLWSLDCMYLGFCVEIIVQFKILCRYLEELTAEGKSPNELETDYQKKIKICIRHHQLLLWFIKEFRQTFSLILLIEYVTVGPLICVDLFAAFESNVPQSKVRHGVIFIVLTTQLSFYCIPANYIADTALAVSDAVYFSQWYSHYFSSSKVPLLLMIQSSHNGITIKAGGLVTINAQTVMNVLKIAWSAASVMRRLRHN